MTYQVVAPLVLVKDQDGQVHHVYAGGHVPWLSDDQAKHFLEEKLVVKVGGSSDSAEETHEGDGEPPKAAAKSYWVDYAVERGYDRAEVEEMTKADIQALDFG